MVWKVHAEAARDGSHPGHVLAVHHDTAAVGHLEPREQAERRRLAAAARTEQGQHLAPLHRERHAIHRHDAVEALHQSLELEKRAHGAARRPVPRTCWSQ
jgi:hypothetical protein